MRQKMLLISLKVLGVLGSLGSCIAPKALPYLQDKYYSTTKPVEVPNTAELYRLQAHDVLSIRVQSVQGELNDLFNITDTRAILGGDPGTLFLSGYAVDEEIAKLARSRRQAAGALSSFRTTRGVVDVGGQSASGIQRQGDLEMARARIVTSRRLYQNLLTPLRQARTTGQLAAPSSAGLDDPALNNLIVQLADLNGKRAALGLNASAANPVVAMLDERLHTTQDALVLMLTSMVRAADIGLRDLDAQLGQVRGQMSRMPEDERQLSSLKSESDFNEKNYNFLVEKRNEAGLALATNTTDKRPVDRAQATSAGPESPNPKLVALVALLAGRVGSGWLATNCGGIDVGFAPPHQF